jgi:NhaA family Na+:H+ antiporter
VKSERRELVGGIMLFGSAILAMILANSPLSVGYFAIAQIEQIKGVAIFFFFLSIGIELRHEIRHGFLSKPKQAVVPVLAAIGGMLVPIAIYSLVNAGTSASAGWGVAMSTDIAFALGALAVAGRWLPRQVRLFVMTVAVVDDSLTILMIALFFASSFHLLSLVSLAGVAVGLFLPKGEKLQKTLQPAVAFVALPVFAFLSAGVRIDSGAIELSIVTGILLAMIVGKPLGVLGATWLVTKSKLGKLPEQLNWSLLIRVGLLFGMCFTVAMLMSDLAFGEEPARHSVANLSVLIGTAVMATLSIAALSVRKPVKRG